MVFKLIRTDVPEPSKILLELGKYELGRGKFLDCEDKRVSRNHGELEVTTNTVIIKSLHQNPCYILRKISNDTQLLKQGDSSEICNGDRFGLLPDSYWYELIYCITEAENKHSQREKDASKFTNNIDDTEPADNAEIFENDDSQVLNLILNETNLNDRSASPSLIQEPIILQENLSQETICNDELSNTEAPVKRSYSQDNDFNDTKKKIKTEPDIKKEPEDEQKNDSQEAGPSYDQRRASGAEDKTPPCTLKQQNPPRERCIYGANCYRRNPQHKAQFSHPSDADWGTDERGECPWGARCRRADPRHWAAHNHPPGVRPPQPAQRPPNYPGKKTKRPKKKDNSDEDTPVEDLIVQGKRNRKTIKRDGFWSGSESENEDPYQTDESDEWQPSGDFTDSQIYTQDTQDL